MTTEVQDNAFNPDLEEALDFEAHEIGLDLELMMNEFLNKADSSAENTLDEMKVRRLVLALKYIKEEAETLKRLKKAVTAEWDRRIKDKEKNEKQVRDLIYKFIAETNKGKSLKLDVGTVSLGKKAANITGINKNALRAFLAKNGELEKFLKPAEIDETLAKNELVNRIEAKTLPLEALEEIGSYEPESKSLSIRMK